MSDRSIALPTAMERAKEFLRGEKEKGTQYTDLIGGKKAISALSGMSQEMWGVQISPMALCRHMDISSVPPEILDAVDSIVN